jgi:oligopeptide transport system substrate-binding protein
MVPPGLPDHEGKEFFKEAGTYIFASDGSKVEEAKKLLAEAGYPDGKDFPEFVILYNTDEGHKLVAEMVQEMFKTNLGITCTLENQEWAVFQDTRKEGDYVMARGGWLTDFLDPSGLLAIFQEGNAYNDPNYLSEPYNTAMNNALMATDKATHYQELYKAQDILMGDLPIIPVYHYTDSWLISEKLQGWDRSILGSIDFSTAELVN